MITLKVKVTTTEELLGTSNADPNIHATYISTKSGDEAKAKEETAAVEESAIDLEDKFEKSITVFPRVNYQPIMWDYQWKGFLKDKVGMLRKIPGTACSKIKSYKKEIDGLIFVEPRAIPIEFDGDITLCQRPLRASTAQGERIALATSEAIPAGAEMTFTIICLLDEHEKMVLECLNHGRYNGTGQWRNSGKGRFTYEILERTKS